MYEFFVHLIDPSRFMPRRQCGSWSGGLVLLHNLSDGLTCASYFAIHLILVHYLRRLPDVAFPPIFWLFGAFIFACGLTHLLEVVVFYAPIYRLIGAVKLATAPISAATVAALIRALPRALASFRRSGSWWRDGGPRRHPRRGIDSSKSWSS